MKQRKLLLMLMLLSSVVMTAQNKWDAQLPVDSKVKIGKLPNGLTYYIRHNKEPKDLAYFYIAQKVGAIQENPDQRGLAHFLEHMCFNGTTHFPGNALREYLERIGVKFGQDLNAYTSVDETVYNIDNVPVKVKNAIDSCLMILHDWSNDLTLDGEEIDKERGVIQEEWRMRNTASQRMHEAAMPVLLAGSKYSDCMPIGSMDIVMNFKHQALRDYYEKWYRPDLQGIIVVGDVDVNVVEQKIKKIFADIPAPPADAAKREYYPVQDNKEPIVFIGSDKENSSPSVQMYFKHPTLKREQKNTLQAVKEALLDSYIKDLFHGRTVEKVQDGTAEFSLCAGGNGNYFLANTMEAFSPYVMCKSDSDGIRKGEEAMVREIRRLRQHGFTESEFKREVEGTLIGIESAYRDRDKRYSSRYVQEYVRHFLDNSPIPGIEYEYNMYKNLLNELTVDDLNKRFNEYFSADGSNFALTLYVKDDGKTVVPTKEELLAIYQKGMQEQTEPYVDNVSNEPFLPKEPVDGTIVSEGIDKEDGLYKMRLGNGAKVVVMKTDFRKDQVHMMAVSRGGLSLLSPDDHKFGSFLNYQPDVAGLGNYTLLQKDKAFNGINATASTALSANYSAVSGSCSPEYIGNMLEQAHAAFLYPHKDEKAFKSLCNRLERQYRESEKQPNSAWGDSLTQALHPDDPYNVKLTADDIHNIDYDHLLDVLRKAYSDASSFTFFFIGNVDVHMMRPYVKKYLASLPSTWSNPVEFPVGAIKPGVRTVMFEKEQETPTARINITLTTPRKYSMKNYLTAQLLGEIMTILYTKTIREDAGAAYSVSAGAQQHMFPLHYSRCQVSFPTSPDKKDLALKLVKEGMQQIADEGPDAEAFNKVRENLLKIDEGNRSANAYWEYVLINKWFTGVDFSKNYKETLNSITLADIQQLMKELLNSGNCVTVVMSTPVAKD